MGQLAERIRQKYPGQYDDLDDASLETKIVAKYPEYKDMAKDYVPETSPDTLINQAKTTLASTAPKPKPATAADIPVEGPVQEAKPGLIKRGWDKVNEPLTDLPSRLAKKFNDFTYSQPEEDPWSARWKGFKAGVVQGTGDLLTNLTSPLNIATEVAGFGALRSVKGAHRLYKALSAPVAAHGAINVAHPDSTLSERAFGIAELAGGLAGVRSKVPEIGKKLIDPKVDGIPETLEAIPPKNFIDDLDDDGPGGGSPSGPQNLPFEGEMSPQMKERFNTLGGDEIYGKGFGRYDNKGESVIDVASETPTGKVDWTQYETKPKRDAVPEAVPETTPEPAAIAPETPEQRLKNDFISGKLTKDQALAEIEKIKAEKLKQDYISGRIGRDEALARIGKSGRPATIADQIPEAQPENNYDIRTPELARQDTPEVTPDRPTATFAFDWPEIGKQYNVKGGPYDKSTVGVERLRELGIDIPEDGLAALSKPLNGNELREIALKKRQSAMDDEVRIPELVDEGAPPIRIYDENTSPFTIDAHRMEDAALSRRADPVQAAATKKVNDDWNKRQKDNSEYEGRFNEPNTRPIPDEQLTPDQLAVRQSYNKIREHSDEHASKFSEAEELLPDGEFYQEPPASKRAYEAEQNRLKKIHEANVAKYKSESSGQKRLGGYAPDPDNMLGKPVKSDRSKEGQREQTQPEPISEASDTPIGSRWKEAIGRLDSRKAKDIEYRDAAGKVAPNTRLRSGETWRGRALKLADEDIKGFPARLEKEYQYQLKRLKETNNGKDFTDQEWDDYGDTMDTYTSQPGKENAPSGLTGAADIFRSSPKNTHYNIKDKKFYRGGKEVDPDTADDIGGPKSKFPTTEGPKGELARTAFRRAEYGIESKLRGELDEFRSLGELNAYVDKHPIMRDDILPQRLNDVVEELESAAKYADTSYSNNVPGQRAETVASAKHLRELADELRNTPKDAIAEVLYNRVRNLFKDESGTTKRPNEDMFHSGDKNKIINEADDTFDPNDKPKSAAKTIQEQADAIFSKYKDKAKDPDPVKPKPVNKTQAEADAILAKIKETETVKKPKSDSKFVTPRRAPSPSSVHAVKGNPILDAKQLDSRIPIHKRPDPILPDPPNKYQQVWDLTRGLKSVDLPFMTSAAFRQAMPLAFTKNWFKAWSKAAGSFKEQAAYDAIMDGIRKHPLNQPKYQAMYDSKGNLASYKELPSYVEEVELKLTDLKSISAREEHIRSQWAELIPGYGRYVKASNRAYTAFLNDLRMNKFADLIAEAERTGKNPQGNVALGKEIADFVNAATGRGSLELNIPGEKPLNFEPATKVLTNVMFSPRLMFSRLKFMNPFTYTQATPMVRKEYTNGMLRSVGAWMGMAGLAKLAGATMGGVDVSFDPTNSDFGKIKIGNTRYDPGGAFQQYMVLASRIAAGGTTSSTNPNKFNPYKEGYKEQTPTGQIVDFLGYKQHPMLDVGSKLVNAIGGGKDFRVADETLQAALPMYTQDIMEAFKDDPSLMDIFVGPASSVGIGAQTYRKGQEFDKSVFWPEESDLLIGRGR